MTSQLVSGLSRKKVLCYQLEKLKLCGEICHSGTQRENNHLNNWEGTSVLDHDREQELLVMEALHNQNTPVEKCFN